MIQDYVKHTAADLVRAIECGGGSEQIQQNMQALVFALGGNKIVAEMTPGVATLYLLALTIRES